MEKGLTIRLIADNDVSDSFGLAADETLARRVGLAQSPVTLRLYTYRSHAALVGRFQTVPHEINTEYCRSHGVTINRRPTGGGAILMGEGQLGVALTIPGRTEDNYSRARELMENFSAGLVDALRTLGIAAAFCRKNDLEVNGRKIAGLGMYRDASGGLLFHASLLVDIDIPLMLRVLRIPFEKISDKEIGIVADRITTMTRELHSPVALDSVRQAVGASFAERMGATLAQGYFLPEELREAEELENARYKTREWIFQEMPVPDSVGTARLKTPAGMLDVTVALAGETIKSVHIGGDFFAGERGVAGIEGSLRWTPAAASMVHQNLQNACDRYEMDFTKLRLEDLEQVMNAAIQRGRRLATKSSADPYGCFVSPGGGSGLHMS